MKLKRVLKSNDDWQKCCRWCHYYENGKCTHSLSPTGSSEEATVYSVAESGKLSEVIEETLHSIPPKAFSELEYLLRDWKISEKRIKEFQKVFGECLDQYLDMEVKPELDEKISVLYQSEVENTSWDSEIPDPEEYCCKEWC